MAVVFENSAFTLRDIFRYTYSKYRNRFEYKDRDVLRGVRVQEIREYQQDRLNQPEVKYKITTYSYPQYSPYDKVKGKRSAKQRKIKHEYDIVLVLENMTMNARFMWREGSQRKWPKYKEAPWTKIKQLNATVKDKFVRRYGKGTAEYKAAVLKHKKRARYLNFGDWVSKVKGINGDFYFRNQLRAYRAGNLYGILWNDHELDRANLPPFFGKHTLRVILYLLKTRKLTY